MSQPTTKDEYERRYTTNFETTGYGIEGVTNHFPCPFCGAPDWLVVRIIDFGVPDEPGDYSTPDITCSECGRSAKHISQRTASGVSMTIVQTGGDDPPEWVPIPRA